MLKSQSFQKKILISTTDAGGAANIAPLCNYLLQEYSIKILTSLKTVKYYNQYGLDVIVIHEDSLSLNEFASELIKEFSPDLILTGTSRYNSLERILIKLCKKKSITSIVVMDEWYNYLYRFRDQGNGEIYYPDIICCQDDTAFKEAKTEGIPENILKTTGSPSLMKLYEKRDKYLTIPPTIPDAILKCIKPIILFLSETHKADYGSDINGGPMGEFLGFTEDSVRSDIVQVLEDIKSPCTLVEKLHPSAAEEDASYQLSYNIDLLRICDGILHDLIWHSDLIIGMRSMALMESVILGKTTISYQPSLNLNYGKSTAERIVKIRKISNKSDLKEIILEKVFLKSQTTNKEITQRPYFANENSIRNILNIIRHNLS